MLLLTVSVSQKLYDNYFTKNLFQNYWEPISTVMITTNDARIYEFYDSYKNSCAPNPVLDLNYHITYNYFEDFLLKVVSIFTVFNYVTYMEYISV